MTVKIKEFLQSVNALSPIDVTLSGIVTDVIYLGESVKYVISVDGEIQVKIKQQATAGAQIYAVGDTVEIGWENESGQVLN